jgi:glycosyltransferase involved in cell wall biosynthesis
MTSGHRPLVSVIMPTYNHGRFVGEALDSVLAQTYTNWELIVVNNYSTDNTEEVLSRYTDPRIRSEKFRNDGIIARARNHALAAARGEYLAFLDSDDAWGNGKLERQLAALSRRADLLACCTALSMFPGGLRSPLIRAGDRRLRLAALKKGNVVYNSSVLMRRSCVDLVGTFNEERELRTIEDYEYWLRLLQHRDGSIFLIDTPLVRYRISGSNQSGIACRVDLAAETAKWDRLAEIRFAGRERELFVRRAHSLIARRCREFGCTVGQPPCGDGGLLLNDWVRLQISRVVKRLIRRMRAGRRRGLEGGAS